MISRISLRQVAKKFVLKDWMIALIGLLIVKEAIAVSVALNQIIYPGGMLASIIFGCLATFFFGQIYTRLNKTVKVSCFLLLGLLMMFAFGDGGSAHAQFLQNAEEFFTAGAGAFGLGESINLLISLIFWLIRGAFVIGVAIALLPAIQAAREGEEWRSLAKTPMLVVGIVLAGATSVDFLTAGVGG